MNIKVITLLPQSKIEEYARNYKRDEKLFENKEKRYSIQLKETTQELQSIKRDIKKLGHKIKPGNMPDYEPYVKPLCSTIGWIWGISLLLVFLLHCCIWVVKLLFDIPWETWLWTKKCFMYGLYAEIACFLGGSLIYGIVYWIWYSRVQAYEKWKLRLNELNANSKAKEKDIKDLKQSLANINTNRQTILAHAFKLTLSLPLRSITEKDFDRMHTKFFDMVDQKESISTLSDFSAKFEALNQFYNHKLSLFHDISIASEAPSPKVLKTISHAISQSPDVRGVLKLQQTEESYLARLKDRNSDYKEHSLDDSIDEFYTILDMDTSGIFTKHSSSALEQQVEELRRINDSTYSFIMKYSDLCADINDTLGVVRLVAYRNIYLGAELLNFLHEGAGGGKLTTAGDAIASSIDLRQKEIKIESFSSSDAIADMITSGVVALSSSVENVLSDKKATAYCLKNPKTAAIGLAVGTAFAIIESGIQAWKKRNAKIDGLISQEEVYIKNMETMVESYMKMLYSSKRALELMKAILKVNKGFVTIYQPISKKVFINKAPATVSMEELQRLAVAIGEFKKISDSKL